MTNTDMTESTDTHDWNEAGDAWGHAALDWSCLFEHYALEVVVAIFERLEIGTDTSLLDIACGAGWALRHAESRGATTSGIDAAASLIEIARDRNPNSDIRLGTMFELPWPEAHFDRVTSINGIWGGCQGALEEGFRVLRPGGLLGISFWGNGRPLDLRGCFITIASLSPENHIGGMRRLNDIATPGVAELMLADAGFDVVERGGRISTLEWPDDDTAWRALASIGPVVPAIREHGAELVRREVMASVESRRRANGSYRFCNDHQFVIARKPE